MLCRSGFHVKGIHYRMQNNVERFCVTLKNKFGVSIYTKKEFDQNTCIPLIHSKGHTPHHKHIQTHTHIHTHTYTLTHTLIHTYTLSHTYIHTHKHIHTHTYTHICMWGQSIFDQVNYWSHTGIKLQMASRYQPDLSL